MRLAKFRQLAMIASLQGTLSNPNFAGVIEGQVGVAVQQAVAVAVDAADALVEANTVPEEEVAGEAIMVWPFYEAPGWLRRLSTHGGDEDWVALVPARLKEAGIIQYFFTQELRLRNPFGISSIGRHELPNGDVAYIGAHA